MEKNNKNTLFFEKLKFRLQKFHGTFAEFSKKNLRIFHSQNIWVTSAEFSKIFARIFHYQNTWITFSESKNIWSNEGALIRMTLFSKNHINSKKNRRKKLNSSIDRKLNVDFRKNNEKFWKKS